eukprot:3805124-Rhodomonas_salina.1
MQALKRIARKGDPVAIEGVLRGLKDSSVTVRYAAVEAMKQIMPEKEIAAITTNHGIIEQIERDRLEEMTRKAVSQWRDDHLVKFFRLWRDRTAVS